MTEKKNGSARPGPGTTPDEASWERPRRPRGPDTPRWIQLAPIVTLAVIACGAYVAFAPHPDEPAGGSPSSTGAPRDPGPTPGTDSGDGGNFEMLSATWGPIGTSDTPEPEPPPSANLTERQQRENAFHEAARERWKGTEIFVRGGPR